MAFLASAQAIAGRKIREASLLEDEGFRKQFSREIRSLVTSAPADGAGVLTSGDCARTPFVVLEFLEGREPRGPVRGAVVMTERGGLR